MVDKPEIAAADERETRKKSWTPPRLETISVAEETLNGTGNTNDGGGAGSSIS